MTWIQTYSGKKLDLLNPRPEDIELVDISIPLSRICRFGGHTDRFYSVAEHSVRCCRMVNDLRLGRSVRTMIETQALMHDAAEAFMGDITQPIKRGNRQLERLEERLWQAICERFGIPHELYGAVKIIDSRMLMTERDALMKTPPEPWQEDGKVNPYPPDSRMGWEPDAARSIFENHAYDLFGDKI